MSVDLNHLVQRDIDGALGPAEAAGVRQMVADQPALAAQATRLHALDTDLRAWAHPLALSPVRVAAAQALHERICAALPLAPPVAQLRIRLVDLVVAVVVAGVLFVGYGVLGTAARSLFQEAVILTWLIGLSLIGGLAMLLAPGFLRSLESGVLGQLLGRPIAIGPADALLYRTAGIALVVGGLWLGR